ncbi:hypothetical protein HME9302_02099 [Alteripontixanthobacter maritimus]|uniref:Uncharacterized protein n=1 Tax=Alteripontixanthobacter maritimus TaxID=2161824 RepID=A0A369Q7M9_9SPHN|nr:hypothetical protein HME9302_02099 [Alteripontixanthobacter maritimus]
MSSDNLDQSWSASTVCVKLVSCLTVSSNNKSNRSLQGKQRRAFRDKPCWAVRRL